MATGLPASDAIAGMHMLQLHDVHLAALVQSINLAVISVDETQSIVLFNPEAEAIFRCSAAQALGGSLDRFIPVDARAIHRIHLENYQGSSTHGTAHGVRTMGGNRIVTGLRADGEEFPMDASIGRTEVAGRKLFTVILRDVTERIHEQEMLRFQSDIINSTAQAIISRRADGTITSWNQAATRFFGYTPEEALGRNINLLYPNAAPPDQIGLAQHAMQGEPVIDFPTKRRRKDGSEIDVEVTISPIKRYDGTVVGTSAIYKDITERKRMEAEVLRLLHDQQRAEAQVRESRDRLRELSSALQTIREEEKTRIARELHDELGQALTALKMDAVAIADELDSTQDAVRKRTDAMKRLIDATVASVRRISADLRPVMLDNLGLVPTLEWLVKEVSGRTGIHITLDIPDENLGVGGDAATAIFRIVQEALTNVARHSGADQVGVEVVNDEGTVVVRVGDNGKGMSAQDAHKARSFGLLGMRERAYVLGGELKVSRAPQGGTLIEAVIPAFGTTGTIKDGGLP
jgi:PAS domain S-box-containing protein